MKLQLSFMFTSLLLFAPFAAANKVKSTYSNNSAVAALKEKRISEAQKQLLNSLREEPGNLAARLNLGVSFIQTGDFEKALKEFSTVDTAATEHNDVRFLARYNIGRVYQEQKKVPEALQAYQRALEVNPDSLEVKTNIELLTSQQQGGGQGGGGNPQQPKDQEGQGQGQDQQPEEQSGDKKEEKRQPQELSESDVQKILEELKSQEQKIRAMEYGTKAKESENGKPW